MSFIFNSSTNSHFYSPNHLKNINSPINHNQSIISRIFESSPDIFDNKRKTETNDEDEINQLLNKKNK